MPKTIPELYETAGGRRFILAMGAGIVATALVWFGKIDAASYKDIVIWTVGAFIAGNTFEAVKKDKL